MSPTTQMIMTVVTEHPPHTPLFTTVCLKALLFLVTVELAFLKNPPLPTRA